MEAWSATGSQWSVKRRRKEQDEKDRLTPPLTCNLLALPFGGEGEKVSVVSSHPSFPPLGDSQLPLCCHSPLGIGIVPIGSRVFVFHCAALVVVTWKQRTEGGEGERGVGVGTRWVGTPSPAMAITSAVVVPTWRLAREGGFQI